MTSALEPLLGKCITSADAVHDYIQLRFESGDVLNVFNEYCLEGDGAYDLRDLVGLCVKEVSEQTQKVLIDLGGLKFCISLLDAAFRGPEAIEYIPASGSRVVWS